MYVKYRKRPIKTKATTATTTYILPILCIKSPAVDIIIRFTILIKGFVLTIIVIGTKDLHIMGSDSYLSNP